MNKTNKQLKICSKCKAEKNYSEFSKCRASKDNLCAQCKLCQAVFYKRKKAQDFDITVYDMHVGFIEEMKICTKCQVEKDYSKFYKNCGTKDSLQTQCRFCQTVYYQDNQEEILERRRQRYQDNREEVLEGIRQRYQGRKDEISVNRRTRRKTDPNYRLAGIMRSRFYEVMKGIAKTSSVTRYLGCTIEEARRHIAAQWTEGMTWKNWTVDGWQLHHIIQLSSFDMRIEEDRYQAWHYTNLQPLWAEDHKRIHSPLD